MTFAVVVLLAAALPLAVMAAPYPDKPVRVLVPTLTGSTPDVIARLVTPELGSRMGNQFIVDNRAGGNGIIGTELAARATPDGYTLLVGTTGTLTVMRFLAKDVPYDTLRDFRPVGMLSVRAYLFVTHPALPVRSVRELVALAKSQPGKTPYGSAGKGSSTHLAMRLFESMAGIDLRHVAYKGSRQATLAVVGGGVPMALLSIHNAAQFVQAQRLRVLAITSSRRSPQYPQVPTVAESGFPGFEALTWFALVAPARTPEPIVARLSSTLQQTLHTPAIRAQLAQAGLEPGEADAAMLQSLIKRDIEFYAKLTKLSGVRVN